MGNAAQISGLNQCRIFLSARAAAQDKRLIVPHKISRHRRLDAHLVYRVDHKVERSSEKRFQIVFRHKILDFLHFALRVDLGNTFAQRRYLRLTEIVGQRMKLAVDIGLGDVVQINQGQTTDARPRQSLHRPRTYPAHADHADVRARKPRQCFISIESGNTAETARRKKNGVVHTQPCDISINE